MRGLRMVLVDGLAGGKTNKEGLLSLIINTLP